MTELSHTFDLMSVDLLQMIMFKLDDESITSLRSVIPYHISHVEQRNPYWYEKVCGCRLIFKLCTTSKDTSGGTYKTDGVMHLEYADSLNWKTFYIQCERRDQRGEDLLLRAIVRADDVQLYIKYGGTRLTSTITDSIEYALKHGRKEIFKHLASTTDNQEKLYSLTMIAMMMVDSELVIKLICMLTGDLLRSAVKKLITRRLMHLLGSWDFVLNLSDEQSMTLSNVFVENITYLSREELMLVCNLPVRAELMKDIRNAIRAAPAFSTVACGEDGQALFTMYDKPQSFLDSYAASNPYIAAQIKEARQSQTYIDLRLAHYYKIDLKPLVMSSRKFVLSCLDEGRDCLLAALDVPLYKERVALMLNITAAKIGIDYEGGLAIKSLVERDFPPYDLSRRILRMIDYKMLIDPNVFNSFEGFPIEIRQMI